MSNRRNFLKTSLAAGIGYASGQSLQAGNKVNVGNSKMGVKNSVPLINCYYYGPHNHTLIAKHIEYDLEKMVSLGTEVVSFCLQEKQMTDWDWKRVDNFMKLSQKFGLKVFIVPSRWGGLMAGWMGGISQWMIQNQDAWYKKEEYLGMPYVNPKHPKVIDHFTYHLKYLIENFAPDGLIWDEPRPYNEIDVILFLDQMSAYCKSLKPDITISIFAEAGALHQADWYCETKHMDYLGSDGHLRSDDYEMHRMKNTIFKAHSVYYPKLKAAGKKTFFLIEGQRHRDENLDNYLENLEKAFSLPMEQLMYYYSAHEMSYKNEEIFNRETWKMVAKISGRS